MSITEPAISIKNDRPPDLLHNEYKLQYKKGDSELEYNSDCLCM